MKLVKEIQKLLDNMLADEQPTEEIAYEILDLIRNKSLEDIAEG